MMGETLRLAEQYDILSEAERSPTPVRVLKHGDILPTFSRSPPVIQNRGRGMRGRRCQGNN
jgi:hypothetical protein